MAQLSHGQSATNAVPERSDKIGAGMTPTMSEYWSPKPRVVTPGNQATASAPSDAIVLFDGTEKSMTDNWVTVNMRTQEVAPAKWIVKDGAMTVNKDMRNGGGNIQTKESFGSFQLHIEWCVPEMSAEFTSQIRGNSGVYLQNMYEVQILDSYNNDTYVNGMAGFEYGLWKSEYTYAGGKGMPNGVDALNACVPAGVSGYKMPGASWATFIQAGYDYAKRYFVTATFRAEASSIFAPGNRVGYFPSVAASWLISNENFMKSQNVVSFLKLRASYGVTGNNNIPAYKYLSTYALGASYNDVTTAIASRLANPVLHWETANMASVGVDLTFIDRIDMSIDLYNTDNTGLLLNVPVAPSTGFFEVLKNAGTVRNQGIEYRLDVNAFKNKDWRVDVGMNIGFNRNRVINIPDHKPFLQPANGVTQQVKEGQDIYTWYMKEWAGVDPANGDALWFMVDSLGNYVLDADGQKTTTNDYNATNPHAVGKATPIFQGGLNAQVSWKGLSLSVNTNFTFGNLVYNYTRMQLDADGAYLGFNQCSIENSPLGWTRWEFPGDEATHPKAVQYNSSKSNAISSRYLEDGSFFRLKNITLSYDFCATLIPKKYMSKLRVFVSADNVFTATKFSGMDPEVSITTVADERLAGMYTDQYPVARNIVGGIEIEF